MGKKKAAALMAGRAWKLLRIALLWARKGGVFKRGLLPDLRLVPNYIKTLHGAASSEMIDFGEREFSFDETPIFHFKMSRRRSARMFRIPCIKPPFDFDEDDDLDLDVVFDRERRMMGCLRRSDADEEDDDAQEEGGSANQLVTGGAGVLEGDEEEDEKCIDAKAEEFITKFYARMKLQRQISLLQYNDMLLRSTN